MVDGGAYYQVAVLQCRLSPFHPTETLLLKELRN